MRPNPDRSAFLEFLSRVLVCRLRNHRWSSRAMRGEVFDLEAFRQVGAPYSLEFGQRRCLRCGKAASPRGA